MSYAFYNEDGDPAIRLYRQNSNKEYVTVDATVSGNELIVNFYSEELETLVTATYVCAADFLDSTVANPALTYKDVYFDTGVKNDKNGEVKVPVAVKDNEKEIVYRKMTEYEYRTGEVQVENVDTVVPVA